MSAPTRLAAVIGITERCNHRCVFCLDTGRRGECDPPLAEVQAMLRALADRGVGHAILMTGESALRPDFPEVLATIRDLGMDVTLTTNGTLLADDGRLRALLDLGLRRYNVSIHAADDATAASISGRPWTGPRQRQALANLDRAASEGLVESVYTKTVVTRLNLHGLVAVAETVAGLLSRVRDVTLGFKQAIPVAEAHADLLAPFDQAAPKLAEACAWARARGLPVVVDGFPLCALPGHEDRSRELQDLVEGLAYVEVRGQDADAEGTLCRMYRKEPGCAGCGLDALCFGADGRVLAVTGGPLVPSRRDAGEVAEACTWALREALHGDRALARPDLATLRSWTRRPTLDEAPLPPPPRVPDAVLADLATRLRDGATVGGMRAESCLLDGDRLEVTFRSPAGTVDAWVGPDDGGTCLARTPGHRLGYRAAEGADPVGVVKALADLLRAREVAARGTPPDFSS